MFLCFCFTTNIIVTSMLILGGAATIYSLSGVNLSAAAFLIPMGVTLYTAQGGLKATFIASWAHVAIIYIALCIFSALWCCLTLLLLLPADTRPRSVQDLHHRWRVTDRATLASDGCALAKWENLHAAPPQIRWAPPKRCGTTST